MPADKLCEDLHASVCSAVAIMNTSIDIARSPEGRNARDILRQALINYADGYTGTTVVDGERHDDAR